MTHMMNRTHNWFGELRQLMNAPNLSDTQRTQLWELIVRNAKESESRHTQQWLPYMHNFPHHFTKPLTTLQRVDQLRWASNIVPFPCLEFSPE